MTTGRPMQRLEIAWVVMIFSVAPGTPRARLISTHRECFCFAGAWSQGAGIRHSISKLTEFVLSITSAVSMYGTE